MPSRRIWRGFVVRRLRGPDLFNHLERTGAPMMPRDVGLVVGKTGVAAADRVLDAGTGTGILSAYMGRIGADVVTSSRTQSSPRSRARTWRSPASLIPSRSGPVTLRTPRRPLGL